MSSSYQCSAVHAAEALLTLVMKLSSPIFNNYWATPFHDFGDLSSPFITTHLDANMEVHDACYH